MRTVIHQQYQVTYENEYYRFLEYGKTNGYEATKALLLESYPPFPWQPSSLEEYYKVEGAFDALHTTK